MSDDATDRIYLGDDPYRVTKTGRRLYRLSSAAGMLAVPVALACGLTFEGPADASHRIAVALLIPMMIACSVLTGLAMRHTSPAYWRLDARAFPHRIVRPFWPLPDRYAITQAAWWSHRVNQLALTALTLGCATTLLVGEGWGGGLGVLILAGVVASRFLPQGMFRGLTRIA